MSEAFAWLGQIIEWFGKFVPRLVIINATLGGVKFIRGAKIRALGPGLHVYWPLITELHTYPTVRQADDLRSQTIVTSDGKTIVAGGMIVYEVRDIEKLLANTFHPESTIHDITLTAIHDVLARLTWPEIQEAQRSKDLDRKLRHAARKVLDAYGVKVLKAMLTDLAPCRVIKLIQSTSHDEG
jgi:regulator of protease activity HflC (stomatin/prohibitin superfamily)